MQNKIKQLERKTHDLENRMNETGGKFQHEKKGLINDYQRKVQDL